MRSLSRLLLAITMLGASLPALSQTEPDSPPESSALDTQLFYQLLLGELNINAGELGSGFSLILDAARKTHDSLLFRRATEIALQGRSGEAALQAARAWQQDQPRSGEASRYLLQILVALNRSAEVGTALKTDLALVEPAKLVATLAALPRLLDRLSDKQVSAQLAKQALASYLHDPDYGPAAWAAIGQLQLNAGDSDAALESARQGLALNVQADGPAWLALSLMEARQVHAESLVRLALKDRADSHLLRMGLVRVLVDKQRLADASQELQTLTEQRPDDAEAWLLLGSVQAQQGQSAAAEQALQRYLALAEKEDGTSDQRQRGTSQAYLTLSQLSEKRKNYAQAQSWLDRIDSTGQTLLVHSRRASLLAKQGQLAQARQLLQALPEHDANEAQAKRRAEVNLLRDQQQYQSAYDLLLPLREQNPDDADIAFDLAVLAERLARFEEAERLWRQVIAARPEDPNAYNALGYSMADRSTRLDEARVLIQKAVALAPQDPFIRDSLGWLEFRLGRFDQALQLLESAYQDRPDAEIAAHLGEVLWAMGQREKALAIWRQGLQLDSDNDTLRATLQRVNIRL